MNKYFPEYSSIDNDFYRGSSYLNKYYRFTWNADILSVSDNYRNMNADKILEDLFKNY